MYKNGDIVKFTESGNHYWLENVDGWNTAEIVGPFEILADCLTVGIPFESNDPDNRLEVSFRDLDRHALRIGTFAPVPQ